MNWTATGLITAVVTLVVGGGIVPAIGFLEKRAMDHPTDRSSHLSPMPRGAGLVFIPAILAGWLTFYLSPVTSGAPPVAMAATFWPVLVATLLLGALSFTDDLKNLSAGLRLGAHTGLCGAVLLFLPGDILLFQGVLPLIVDRLAILLIWVWFVNLYNFMDGIDGLTAAETVSIGAGLAVLAGVGTVSVHTGGAGLIMAGALLGFFWWNRYPAQVFAGDVGSIPLGFLTGWLLITTAAEGQWAVALILPMYYLMDATVTLGFRIVRLEKFWEPHKNHAYQIPVAGGASPSAVVRTILWVNVALVLLATLSRWTDAKEGLIIFAMLLTGRLYARFSSWGKKEPSLKENAHNIADTLKENFNETGKILRDVRRRKKDKETPPDEPSDNE